MVSHGHSICGMYSVGVLLLKEKVRKFPTVAKIGACDFCRLRGNTVQVNSVMQMAMSGGVNSGTVYNMNRGRGYYPSRGGGRGGRGKNDFYNIHI